MSEHGMKSLKVTFWVALLIIVAGILPFFVVGEVWFLVLLLAFGLWGLYAIVYVALE